MRDEEHGQRELVAQVAQQVDHLRLDRHVQRRQGLVGHDEFGLHRQGAGHADALALSPGEFVGIARSMFGRQADQFEQLGDALGSRFLAFREAVGLQRFSQDVAHAHFRIQAGIRVLEDHLQLAAQGAHATAGSGAQLLTAVAYAARCAIDQTQQRAADGALARARFANQAQRFTGLDGERDIVHRAHRHGRGAEELLQVLHFDQGRHAAH